MIHEHVVVHCRENELILIGSQPIQRYPLQGADYNLVWNFLLIFGLYLLSRPKRGWQVRKVLPIDVELRLPLFDFLGCCDESEEDMVVELIRALHYSF